jgi:hypothetical protein
MLSRLVVGGVVALTGLGGAAVAATSVKAPERQDVAAARSVITALGRFDQAALDRQSAATSAAKAAVASVQRGCDGAIPKSAQNGTGTQQSVVQDLLAEASLDVSLAVNRPLSRPLRDVAASLGAAHFSSRSLSRAFEETSRLNHFVTTLSPTDLCADVKAAAAGHFDADPPATTTALKHISFLSSSHALSLAEIPGKLAPFLVTARDRAALSHVKALNARYGKVIRGVELTWERRVGSVLDE